MLREVLEGLAVREGGRYIDATFGRGGHSAMILERLGQAGRLLALDRDPQAIAWAQRAFGADPRLHIEHVSFSHIREAAERALPGERFDGILLDLGVSSPQLEDPQRGFSFRDDGPLDMRMDPDCGPSAAEWLARATEAEIGRVIRELGEERYWRRIARAIVQARRLRRIERTGELAAIIGAALPRREHRLHPATRTFQAIRIQVNRELDELAACLLASLELLARGGRLAVVSFHSLEDRIAKRFIREHARPSAERPARLRALGKIRASGAEVAANPRARSAMLRLAERLP